MDTGTATERGVEAIRSELDMVAAIESRDDLFRVMGKHRIYASVDPRNLPSIKLLERIGMRKEALFKKSLWFKGAWADDLIYAVLDEEWS